MTDSVTANDRIIVGILLTLVLYVAAVSAGGPQRATAKLSAQQKAVAEMPPNGLLAAKAAGAPLVNVAPNCPPLWMMLPFALILVAIAVLPLLRQVSHWWESNLHKLYVVGSLSLGTLAYYLLLHRHGVVEPLASGIRLAAGKWRAELGSGGHSAIQCDPRRIPAIYHPAFQLVYDYRRDPHQRRSAGPFLDQYALSGGGRRARQPDRHDGRLRCS